MTPREFLDTTERRAVEEWRRDPLDELRAKQAANELNNMVDRMFQHYGMGAQQLHGAKKAGEYREALVQHECSDFQLLWDVADAHKHVVLARPSRRITRDEQTASGRLGYGEGRYGEALYGGVEQLVVKLDAGERRPLSTIIENVFEMWERIVPT